jgi:hypothetical protein
VVQAAAPARLIEGGLLIRAVVAQHTMPLTASSCALYLRWHNRGTNPKTISCFLHPTADSRRGTIPSQVISKREKSSILHSPPSTPSC